MSDVVLAVRAKDGDRRALEVLVERHEPSVRRLAGYLLSDPQDAEDASQESLAKLCTRIDQFRGASRFTTWLHSLVANTCRDVGERQRRRRHQSLDVVAERVAPAAGRTTWRCSVSSAAPSPCAWPTCPRISAA